MIGRMEFEKDSKEFVQAIEKMSNIPMATVEAFMHLLCESELPPKNYETARYRFQKFFKQHARDFALPIPDAHTYPEKQLFRIRKDCCKIDDPTNVKEWGAPPHSSLGRFNLEGERVLYVGTSEELCRLESAVENDELYYLAEYRVVRQSPDECIKWQQSGHLGLNSLFYYPREFFVGNIPILIQQLAEYIASDSANRYYTNFLYKYLCESDRNGRKTHGLIYTSRFFPAISVGDLGGVGVLMDGNHNIALNHYGIARIGLVSVKLKKGDVTLCEYKFDNVSIARPIGG